MLLVIYEVLKSVLIGFIKLIDDKMLIKSNIKTKHNIILLRLN